MKLAACGLALLCACNCASALAASIQLNLKETTGKEIIIPAPDKPTIVAFLRIAQQQSADALAQLVKESDAHTIIVLSGGNSAEAVGKFIADNKLAAPIILDKDYELSGKLSVHVWPTTVVIAPDGTEAAHLAGLPPTYARDVHAYLQFAEKKIDKAALEQMLSAANVVAPTPQQAATRYVIIADALIEREQLADARAEIERGLKLQPNETSLKVALVRVMLKQKQYAEALAAADQLKDAAAPWQVNVLRAEALVALERWPEAKTAAADAVRLNPKPAQAHYLAGLVWAHDNDWPHAAESFRRAYESAQTKQ
jgi:tetratricopeptide (TPR) repeat protein